MRPDRTWVATSATAFSEFWKSPGSSGTPARAASKAFCSDSAPARLPSLAKAVPRAKWVKVVDSGPASAGFALRTLDQRPKRTKRSSVLAAAYSTGGISLAMAAALAENSSDIFLAAVKLPVIEYDARPNWRLWL